MLKNDKETRTNIMEKKEKEEFELFPNSFYKTKLKVPKKVHKCDVEDEEYKVSYRSVRDRDDQDSIDDEEEDPKTPPHQYSASEYYSED